MRKRRTRFAVSRPDWFRSLGFTFLTVQRSKCEFILKECVQGGGRDDWIFKEVDEQNIPTPPTYDEVTAAPKFRNARFKSASHKNEECVMYRLGTKAEQLRGVSHEKDIAFVSDTIFKCVALATT